MKPRGSKGTYRVLGVGLSCWFSAGSDGTDMATPTLSGMIGATMGHYRDPFLHFRQQEPTWQHILLMDEILHHLGALNYCSS